MVVWRKAGDPLQSATKRDQWVRGWLMQGKAKANNPLLAAVAGLVFLVVVGSGVCWRLEFLCANGDVAQKPATPFSRQKSATNGRKVAKIKANPLLQQGQDEQPLAPQAWGARG
jgi:hypothetical protein